VILFSNEHSVSQTTVCTSTRWLFTNTAGLVKSPVEYPSQSYISQAPWKQLNGMNKERY